MTALILPLRQRLRVVDAVRLAARNGRALEYQRPHQVVERCRTCREIIRNGRCNCPDAA